MLVLLVPAAPMLPSAPGHGAPSYRTAAAQLSTRGSVPGAVALVPHSAIDSYAPGPNGTTPPGEQLSAGYEVEVPNYTASLGTPIVRVPNVLVRLPTTTGAIHLYLDAVNITVTSSAPVAAGAGPLTHLPAAETFNATSAGELSSQGLAVMAAWPYGEASVLFRWHWTSVGPDGSVGGGVWSNWTTVVPAELVDLGGQVGRTWTVASPYELCLTGALAGRTFSLRVATTSPPSQLDGGEASGGAASYLCWNNSLPDSTPSQSAVVHLWETDNTTFLLEAFDVDLVAAGSPTSWPPPASSSALIAEASGGVLAAAVALVLLHLVLRSKRPRTSEPPAVPPLVAGPPPPPAPPEFRPPPPS